MATEEKFILDEISLGNLAKIKPKNWVHCPAIASNQYFVIISVSDDKDRKIQLKCKICDMTVKSYESSPTLVKKHIDVSNLLF